MTKTLLDKSDIKKIADNIVFTRHSLERAKQRLGIYTESELIELIKRASNGWNNIDRTLNIILNETSYITLAKEKNKYIAITIKGESKNGVSIASKIRIAMKNISFKRGKHYDNTKTNRYSYKDTKENNSPTKRKYSTNYGGQWRNYRT